MTSDAFCWTDESNETGPKMEAGIGSRGSQQDCSFFFF